VKRFYQAASNALGILRIPHSTTFRIRLFCLNVKYIRQTIDINKLLISSSCFDSDILYKFAVLDFCLIHATIRPSALVEYQNDDAYTSQTMGRRKTSAPPKGKRTNRPNMVAAAVELAGGPNAVAKLCGVRRQSVYWWIKEWKVERLVDALKLSHASGIPIEKLAGESTDGGSNAEPKGPKPAP
jgi:hypothetical protein